MIFFPRPYDRIVPVNTYGVPERVPGSTVARHDLLLLNPRIPIALEDVGGSGVVHLGSIIIIGIVIFRERPYDRVIPGDAHGSPEMVVGLTDARHDLLRLRGGKKMIHILFNERECIRTVYVRVIRTRIVNDQLFTRPHLVRVREEIDIRRRVRIDVRDRQFVIGVEV